MLLPICNLSGGGGVNNISAKERVATHMKNNKRNTEENIYVEKAISYCKDNNINLIIVITPVRSDFGAEANEYGDYKSHFKDIVDILQKELGTNLDYEWIKNPYEKAYQFHTQAHLSENFYTSEFELEAGIKDYLPEIKRIFEKEYNA